MGFTLQHPIDLRVKVLAEYWKAYAKKLEAIRFPESKKKQQSKLSKNCIKKDTE